MPNIVEKGYLEDPYLNGPEGYLGGQVYHGVRSQINRQISITHRIKEQTNQAITTTHHVKEQIQRQINSTHRAKEQTNRDIATTHHAKEQIDRSIGTTHRAKEQVNRQIVSLHHAKEQVLRKLEVFSHIKSQIDRDIQSGSHRKHTQIKRGHVLFTLRPSYLEDPYLEGTYLSPGFNAHVRSQVSRFLTKQHVIKEQIQLRIDTTHHGREQVLRRIDALHRIAEQVLRIASHKIHSQITQVLYNTTQLRVMLDFPSRGTSGTNWTANSTMAGDFSVNNLNTDIVEQVWRSNNAKTGIILVCDTQVSQGIFVDTLAILNHNFTTSASILWEASNDPGFATVGFSHVLTSATTNIYYIAPTLPTEGFKYHRFTIDDNTNSSDYLQIGTIVFGSTIIFHGENFVDQVTRQTVHFADKIKTEAFTNVSNDRAIKTAVGLEFRNLNFNGGNYAKMRQIFETARTSFKCLWIPTPQYPSRFGIFAKLEAIPQETHNDLGANNDYVSFSINVDESL